MARTEQNTSADRATEPDSLDGPEYFGKDLEAMSFARNYHQWILDEFSPFLGRSVAEIGAGSGNFSQLLLGTNIEALTAFEPSRNMFPRLQKILGGDPRVWVQNSFFQAARTTQRFDSILYVNVLEHIEDDRAEMVNAYSGLNSGGYLLVFVPALQWLYSEFDKNVGHFRRYCKRNLIDIVTEAGFSPTRATYFDLAGIIPWYINFKMLKNPMRPESVDAYDRLVVPLMKRLESAWHPPIGKNLLLIARKK